MWDRRRERGALKRAKVDAWGLLGGERVSSSGTVQVP